ncbi:MAG TPA: glutamate--cysteine ligase [Legionella sp.]|nr:glutamate--cysteine ligase [Legionella sp.]
MPSIKTSIPQLTAEHACTLHPIEAAIIDHEAIIEDWFRKQWIQSSPSITSSVDLRHAGFKIAPVDTNLFPAGYNNLNREFLPGCVQAAQAVMKERANQYINILMLPESHTRNQYYFQSLDVLRDIFSQAGFTVRFGSLDSTLTAPVDRMLIDSGNVLRMEPLLRRDDRLVLDGFEPCFVLLNNDLSSGIPDILKGLQDNTQPPMQLGWSSRLKSDHFQFFSEVAQEFSALVHLDAWLVTPLFKTLDGVDFMAQTGLDALALVVDELLAEIRKKYVEYGVEDKPFVVVKADNGTYGMGVMMVHDGAQLLSLNRKQRTNMSSTKGHQKLNRLIIQEGVYSFETMPDGAVAEPVLYMIGACVVGGFYRVHQGRGPDENLNAPGMHFIPLPFEESCLAPTITLDAANATNQYYVYGVIARLAALAAAREIAAIRGA